MENQKKSKIFKKSPNIALGEVWMGKIVKNSLDFILEEIDDFVIWGKFMQIHGV